MKSKFFSKIDLSKGYWQITLTEKHWSKIAFVTLDEAKKFLRILFGIKHYGLTPVRGMKKVLSSKYGIESYVNNLIVFFNYGKRHFKTSKELLKKLSETNLTAMTSKCIFQTSTVSFLGHHVGYDWITSNDDNLDIISRAKRPVTKKKTRLLCWLLGYYGD